MYHLTNAMFYLLSLLPFRVLHGLSDMICFLVYHLIGYRKKVVLHNLRIAFPEKTEEERISIAKRFYRNLIDTFMESARLMSMTEKQLRKRFRADFELINRLKESGQSVQLHSGHFFNWEFANYAFAHNLNIDFLGVYMPIKNKTLNRFFYKLRSRFGTRLIAATRFKEEFLPYSNQQYCLALVGDQNQGVPAKAYWIDFFGRKTPFIRGLEAGARANNTAVVFCHFYPVKRGYYEAELKLITTEPNSLPEGEITRQFVEFLEESIRRQPSNYLWSHRRWKHRFQESFTYLERESAK